MAGQVSAVGEDRDDHPEGGKNGTGTNFFTIFCKKKITSVQVIKDAVPNDPKTRLDVR